MTDQLVTAPDCWSYAGTDLSTLARFVMQVTGADDLPAIRGDNLTVPGAEGLRRAPKMWGSRTVSLVLWVGPLTATGTLRNANQRIGARQNLDDLMALFSQHREASLVHTMPDTTTRTAQAEVVKLDSAVATGEVWTLGVDLLLADPFFYGPPATFTKAIPTTGVTKSVDNTGTYRTSHLTLDFLGPITNPRVTLPSGAYLQVSVAVPAAQHLIIDCVAFTALLNGVSVIGSVIHAADTPFLVLETGTTVLTLTGTGLSGATSLSLVVTPPFV